MTIPSGTGTGNNPFRRLSLSRTISRIKSMKKTPNKKYKEQLKKLHEELMIHVDEKQEKESLKKDEKRHKESLKKVHKEFVKNINEEVLAQYSGKASPNKEVMQKCEAVSEAVTRLTINKQEMAPEIQKAEEKLGEQAIHHHNPYSGQAQQERDSQYLFSQLPMYEEDENPEQIVHKMVPEIIQKAEQQDKKTVHQMVPEIMQKIIQEAEENPEQQDKKIVHQMVQEIIQKITQKAEEEMIQEMIKKAEENLLQKAEYRKPYAAKVEVKAEAKAEAKAAENPQEEFNKTPRYTAGSLSYFNYPPLP